MIKNEIDFFKQLSSDLHNIRGNVVVTRTDYGMTFIESDPRNAVHQMLQQVTVKISLQIHWMESRKLRTKY